MQTQVPSSRQLTPLMQQYWDIKAVHGDKIVLFRMGDFFEMFYRDAQLAAPILNIALTSRNKKAQDETPMCGIPHHSVGPAITKLLQAGHRVAICDQVEDPKLAKGLVKRAVTRVLTPGVVYDPEALVAGWAHYIFSQDEETVSFMDTSTGEAFFLRWPLGARRQRLLETLRPAEEIRVRAQADPEDVAPWLVSYLEAEPEMAPAGGLPLSATRLVSYLSHVQGEATRWLAARFEDRTDLETQVLPPSTLRHLEVFSTQESGDRGGEGTLVHALDATVSAMGSRSLKRALRSPLTQRAKIEARLDRLSKWTQDDRARELVRGLLKGLGDLERMAGKLSNPSCNPRDLLALAESLETARAVLQWVSLQELGLREQDEESLEKTVLRIRSAIRDDAPVSLRAGRLIKKGVSTELDELIDLSEDGGSAVVALEAREREATGISSLKVRYNQVFGYSIEVTNTHRDKIPAHYVRKQTLANAERYITEELSLLEGRVLSAESRRIELEEKMFRDLVASLVESTPALLSWGEALARLDVDTSLAHLARVRRWVRPEFVDHKDGIELRGSRHPVVELALPRGRFVKNDINLRASSILLLTGPNMAGKSTLMRQVALACLMAQMGSFVPADDARLPIFDAIHTRIGAGDQLAKGRSTFMVEMSETADLLRLSTERSLILLDEIGRGTSTYDGLSLAQALLEHLERDVKCVALFATHYHELAEWAKGRPQVDMAHMRIAEQGDEIVFLHEISKGAAGRSYGLHVAKLAGLPAAVLRRASEVLKGLEQRAQRPQDIEQLSLPLNQDPELVVDERTAQAIDVVEKLEALDLDRTTPIDALLTLRRLREDAKRAAD